MERESFDDQEVADLLNRYFVSIKVDREERPDIDHIYMSFCQALTGHGGWPLTVFMTPEQQPFYAGTYFPKTGAMGIPGLLDILERVRQAWHDDWEALRELGKKCAASVGALAGIPTKSENISKEILHEAYEILEASFDPEYGGFSRAPKFPTPHNLFFLLRYWKATKEPKALEMVEKTLEGIYRGGIFDHIGFGFSRYSTDDKWLVPHFEKMLYDNALLAIAYSETYQATQKQLYAQVARKIFAYVLGHMKSPEGAFYSAEDADSEGEEGKFYLFSPNEIIQILGQEDGQGFCRHFSITPGGNFGGKSIPNLINAPNLNSQDETHMDALRQKVFEYREQRVHPFKDDKILTGWNALMIAAMAIGGRYLEDGVYIHTAETAMDFIFTKLMREDGRLLARYRDNEAAHPAYVDDYAYTVWALIELYETTYNTIYLYRALDLNREMLRLFWDQEEGGLFLYGKDGERLIARPKEFYDGALPSGNSVAAMNFMRLARMIGDVELDKLSYEHIKTFYGNIVDNPNAYTHFLLAVMYALYPTREIIIVGDEDAPETQEMLKVIRGRFLPFAITLFFNEVRNRGITDIVPFLRGTKQIQGKTTAYVCEAFACQAPVTDIESLVRILEKNDGPNR
jgi:uncharacterized protein YyaL (SSP411 family)